MTESGSAPGEQEVRRGDATPGALPTLINTTRYGFLVKWRKTIVDRMVAARSRRAKASLKGIPNYGAS